MNTENDQTKLWNGSSGNAWVDLQELLDQVLQPFEDLLLHELGDMPGSEALDVGCGTGSTTLAVARMLGANGRCTGVDISEPMITAARARAEREQSPARFVLANAQDHAFDPARFDMLISRFGVMFFEDFGQAFTNLRRAATDEAQLRFIAWRSPSDNPFMTTAERTAAPLLPNIPPRRPDGPGQFAFADRNKVQRILEESGWGGIDIRPIDVPCAFPEKELVRYFTRLGPLGMILQETDDRTRMRIIETVRSAFDPFVHGADVRFTAACWMIEARAATARARGSWRITASIPISKSTIVPIS